MNRTGDKNAHIHELVETLFQDSHTDGFPRFQRVGGQTTQFGFMVGQCVCHVSFYPSPIGDFDVADFHSIDPRLGKKDVFSNFIQNLKL